MYIVGSSVFNKKRPLLKVLKKKIIINKYCGNSKDMLYLSKFILTSLSLFNVVLQLKKIKKKEKKFVALFILLLQKKRRQGYTDEYSWTGVNYLLRGLMTLINNSIILFLKFTYYNIKQKPYFLLMNRLKGCRFSDLVTKSMRHVEPSMLLKFLVYSMNKVEFVQHRWMLKRLMWQFDYGFDTKYLLSGLMLIIFGKINVGGNSRTRTLSYINGVRANSKSWLRGKRYNDIVNTTTGCLGLSLAYFL